MSQPPGPDVTAALRVETPTGSADGLDRNGTRLAGSVEIPIEGTTPPPAAPSDGIGGYVPGLDGIRAIGMTAMLLYHAEIWLGRGAFLALSQFFTMSGYLVTTVLLRRLDKDDGIGLRRFWLGRVRRLWPGSIAALGVIALFSATVATYQQKVDLPAQVFAAAANVANWAFIIEDTSYIDQFASPSPVQHFWSLSVEEQFYLVLPLGLALFLRRSRSLRTLAFWTAGATALAAGWMILLHTSGASVDRIYYGTDTRMAELLVGVLLAVVLTRRPISASPRTRAALGWAGAACYAVTLWMFVSVPLRDDWMWSGGITLFSLMSCVVILGVLSGAGPLRALSVRPLAAMGRITYGLYLYHLPIFLWLTSERTGLSQWPLLALRVAVTFAAALASFFLLEQPIRHRRALTTGRARFVVGPVMLAAALLVTALSARSAGDDPFGTIRGDASEPPPASPVDPSFEVLVVTDEISRPIADHLADAPRGDDAPVITTVPFECDALREAEDGWTCPAWGDRWAEAVERVDPDAVLLLVDDWTPEDIRRAGGDTGEPLDEVAEQALSDGIDHLSAGGATVVWAPGSVPLAEQGERRRQPFHAAMTRVLKRRSDVRVSPWLAPRAATQSDEDLDQAVSVVEEALRTHRRTTDGGGPRVMVVGDSQAQSLGYGLERLGAESGDAVVWNAATQGCGIADDGEVDDLISGEVVPAAPECADVVDAWSTGIEDFGPDLVIVLSSLRDLQDRRIEAGGELLSPGDPELDAYLVDTYIDAVDRLAAGGATVVWMQPPCVRYVSPFGGGGDVPGPFRPERMQHLDEVILPAVVEARPEVELYDLGAVLCPDGEFLEEVDGVGQLRPDGIHLSIPGSAWLAEQLQRDVVGEGG